MNEYIIYTAEGYTFAPNEGVKVENCQVLGRAHGNNSEDAKDNLLKANPWITEAGFNRSEFIVEQLMTDEGRKAIKEVLNYLRKYEECHWEEWEKTENSIFNGLKYLKALI